MSTFMTMMLGLVIGFSIFLVIELLTIAFMNKHQKGDIRER